MKKLELKLYRKAMMQKPAWETLRQQTNKQPNSSDIRVYGPEFGPRNDDKYKTDEIYYGF